MKLPESESLQVEHGNLHLKNNSLDEKYCHWLCSTLVYLSMVASRINEKQGLCWNSGKVVLFKEQMQEGKI